MNNLLIIGCNSYVGRHLVHHINTTSHAFAKVVTWSSQDCNLLDPQHTRESFAALAQSVKDGARWSVIFLSVINKFAENSANSLIKNISMVKHFIEQSRLLPIKSLIYFSAADVYGTQPPQLIEETSPLAAESWYSLAKINCEWMLSNSSLTYPVTIARIPGVYGYGGIERSIPYRMLCSIRDFGEIRIEGDGETLRDMVFVPDLCKVITKLIEQPYSGAVNLVSGKSQSINQIATCVRSLFDNPPPVIHAAAQGNRNFDLVFDNKKLHSLIPDFSFNDLKSGISSYLPMAQDIERIQK